MKRDRARTAVLLLVNGFISWWLIKLTIEEYSILSARNLALTGIAIVVLLLGVLIDWTKPNLACAWNIAIWWMATALQAWAAVHARWGDHRWSEQKVGFLLSLPITLLICLVYFMNWRDTKRRAA